MIIRLAKRIVCNVLYYSGILHLYMKYVFLKRRSFSAVIINYHSFIESYDGWINPAPAVYIPVKDFRKMLSFLKRYFTFISLDELTDHLQANKTFDRPVVALTIDDGFKDNYDRLLPILKEENIPATIYLAAGFIESTEKIWVEQVLEAFTKTQERKVSVHIDGYEKDFAIDTFKQKQKVYSQVTSGLKDLPIKNRLDQVVKIREQLKVETSKEPMMLSWNQIKEMEKHKVTFGAHTMTHPILSRMPVEEAKKEILDSKHVIEEKLGHPVRHFAYPNGRVQDFSEELREYCKTIGFETVSTTVWGSNNSADDCWGLKRVSPCLPMSVFALYVIRAFKD